jgi:hypothetical protein
MRHRPKRQASPPKINFLRASLLVAIGLLSALPARGETAASSPGEEARWQPKTVLQFAVRADYVGAQSRATRRDAVVGTAHLRFESPARPLTAGLMIEYRIVDEQADTLLVAGMFTYQRRKWTAAASPYYQRTAQRAGADWHYWGSVRRYIASRHALGVELFGALETGRPAKWMLGYYGTITESLSVSVAAGSGFDAGPDWVASTSVTWRPRPRPDRR